jgi:hypothetical protein
VFLICVRNKDFDAAKMCAVHAMFRSVFDQSLVSGPELPSRNAPKCNGKHVRSKC